MKNKILKILKSSRFFYISVGLITGVIATIVVFLIPNKNPTPYYPSSSYVISDEDYYAVYDTRTKSPICVYSSINSPYKSLTQNVITKPIPNKQLPLFLQVSETDYTEDGYVPEQLALMKNPSSTGSFSTCVALTPKFADGYWKNFKTYLQKELDSSNCEGVDVFIGPLFLVSEQSHTMEYKLTGSAKVAVPTHLFVVLNYCLHAVESKAYIIPTNLEISKNNFEDLEVSFEELEKSSGLIFSKDITNPTPTISAPGL